MTGVIDPAFQPVADRFEASLADGTELGAACAVFLDGKLVLDLKGGFTDRKKETPWTDETIVSVYSSGKAIVALLTAMAVERDLLTYDQKISDLWPDFTGQGKDTLTVAQMLSHQSGICGFPEETDPSIWLDWDATCAKIAGETPMWSPGTANGYHPQTFGFMAGEVLRRATGLSFGPLLREWLTGPEELAIYCGLTPDQQAYASGMTKPPRAPDLGPLNDYKKTAFLTKWASPAGVSREAWMAAEIPASNMHADARSLARAMSLIVEREGPLGDRVREDMFRERISGDDLVLPFHLSWAAGMMRNSNHVYGPMETALGHSGFGGSCVIADPVNRLAFAYTPNKMSEYLVGDPRAVALVNTVYGCL